MRTKREFINNIIKQLEKLNPYPESIFTEISTNEWEKASKILKDNGISPDRIFGGWGRKVWNNCINNLKDIIKEI